MCGILSVFCKNAEKNVSTIKDQDMLSNRGPDDSATLTEPHIMIFKRLSIVDQTRCAMQPFIEGDTRVLCNGEIYNHLELEKKYDLRCRSQSDCECILHLYKKVGWEQTVTHLRGDFALIIIDGNDMYFARDRIGVRPLFWGRTTSGNLALASYARALTGFCESVKQVPPGYAHYNARTNQIRFKKYSYPEYITYGNGVLSTAIKNTLFEAVKSRLMSDRPIACLLSGGLDSSLIVSILCKLIGNKNVRTYSIGMEGSQDLEYAKKVASALGTNHTEVKFTPEEGFAVFRDVIRDLESYDITTIRASVGMWLLAKWISENTDNVVLFSGEGSDELFCGYLYFHYAPTTVELKAESLRLVNELYLYDVLRADRCISSHGLELRVPFLDHDMVNLCLNIPGEFIKPINGVEKHILRTAFADGFLPDEVLWRRKDGMSDGVSGKEKKWFEHIQEFVEDIITDDIYDKKSFPSKEAQYYRMIYNELFPTYQPVYDYWLPKWVNHGGDPSGRILDVFKKIKTEK